MFSVEQLVANVAFDKLVFGVSLLEKKIKTECQGEFKTPLDLTNLPSSAEIYDLCSEDEWEKIQMVYSVYTLTRLAYEYDFEDSEQVGFPSSYYKTFSNVDSSSLYELPFYDFSAFSILVMWGLGDNAFEGGSDFLREELAYFLCDWVSVVETFSYQQACIHQTENLK